MMALEGEDVVGASPHADPPALGLGAASLGDIVEVSGDQAYATLESAMDCGIRMLDTAPAYGAGESERRVGRFLEGRLRAEYVISTKVGNMVAPTGDVVEDFTRDGVLKSVEGSLRRLGTDRIDIVHVHHPQFRGLSAAEFTRAVLNEVGPALNELRDQGCVQYIGLGLVEEDYALELVRRKVVDCVLMAYRYTLLEQGALKEFFPLCMEHDVPVFLAGVFNTGILATGSTSKARFNYRNAPEEILSRVRAIERVCAIYNVPLAAVALQFALAPPMVARCIVGAISPTEIANAAANARVPIPQALWEHLIDERLIPEGTAPKPRGG
jgi:D-threo-aldose 1-dehydrogenase